jgi:TolB protein
VLRVALLCVLAAGLAGAASKRAVIAFGSERGGPFRIHVLGVRPGAQQRTLQSAGAGMDVQPSWSPDGRRLAISTSDASGQDFDIAVVNASGSDRTRITGGAGWDEEPAWSPNGQVDRARERPGR